MFPQEWDAERRDCMIRAASAIPFGVSFLDDALTGILPGQLMLVGARTGRGKTALASMLATNMAGSKKFPKKVVFFALEAEKWEIHSRILHRKTAELYYKHYGSTLNQKPFPRFQDWIFDRHSQDFQSLEAAALSEVKAETANLKIYYKQKNYTPDEFAEDLKGSHQEHHIFIVDHLHFFDFGSKTEFEGLKRTAHLMRNLALEHETPVILLAHLRKADRGGNKTLPDIDDFHGHSDIAKVATAILLLAPAPIEKSVTQTRGAYPTYMQIAKMRTAGEVTPYVAVHDFEATTNRYSERYRLEKAHFNSDPTPIENRDDYPTWAKRALRPTSDFASNLARKAPPTGPQRD